MLISAFSDTFAEDLEGRPLLVGPDEEITYEEDPSVTPLNVARPRITPIGWRAEADLLVRKLLKSCIIERVNHCTKWCSPATFVPKPSGKGLRLVTDFRAINKHIKRPVYPFPDVNQLKSNIPPDTKFLAKLDFSSGYYQVGLAEKSRDLTCFLLPQGRFRYTRTPMGLASSGDLFVSRTMKIISDLPGIQALVDDVLVVASSFKQLIHRLYVLLQRLQKNQATISLKKFDINRALDVAGTNIT